MTITHHYLLIIVSIIGILIYGIAIYRLQKQQKKESWEFTEDLFRQIDAQAKKTNDAFKEFNHLIKAKLF